MSDTTGTPTQGPQSAWADARGSLGALARLLVGGGRLRQLGWASDFLLAATSSVLVLATVNGVLSHQDGGQGSLGDLATFLVGVGLNYLLMNRLARRALANLTQAVSATSERAIDALCRLDLEQFESVGREEIIARISGDAGRIVPSSNVIVQVLIALATVVLSMVYTATISAQAALVSTLAMVLLALLAVRINHQVMEQNRRDQAARRRMQEPLDDLLLGFKQLKQHGPRSAAVAALFESEATALRDSRGAFHSELYLREAVSSQFYFLLLGGVSFVLPLLLPEIAAQASQLMIAAVFVFRPVSTLVMEAPTLARIAAAWQRLKALTERLEALASEQPELAAPPQPFQHLSMQQVQFRYAASELGPGFAVGPCDLELRPGEIVFVTGANGSGKSTFVKLLCGLYKRHAGDLALDGKTLPADAGPVWRGQFAAVFAEYALFEQVYGHEDTDPAYVQSLLEQMELSHKVRFAQGRFDTIELSTGQRKRLALVLALLQDRPIYVFDEWAADQDPHFRQAFYRRILPELKARGKAVVAITHDDDAFDACDQRIHFERGRIVPT